MLPNCSLSYPGVTSAPLDELFARRGEGVGMQALGALPRAALVAVGSGALVGCFRQQVRASRCFGFPVLYGGEFPFP